MKIALATPRKTLRRSVTPRASRGLSQPRLRVPSARRKAKASAPASVRRAVRPLSLRKTTLRVKPAGVRPAPVRKAKGRAPLPDIWKRYARQGQGSPAEAHIVEQYLPLVKTVVGRLAMTLPAHAATEDLYSAGLVGLLNAVRRYNPQTGVQFETYARVRIRGSVFDELRRLDWVPRSVHDKARKVEQVMRQLEQKHGQIPTPLQMARALNMTEEDYEQLVASIKPATFVCLDSVRSAEQEGEATQHEAVADASQPDPGRTTVNRELARIIMGRLQHLPEVQRKVLALYYFEDLRLREIAEVFGVTESRISQIHAAAVMNIRSYLGRHDTIRQAA